MSAPELMTVDDVARETGTHRNTVYRWMREGDIPSVRLGRRLYLPRVEFERIAGTREREAV